MILKKKDQIISSLQSNLSTKNTEVSNLKNDISIKNRAYSSLQTDLNNLRQENCHLESIINDKRREIDNLNTRLNNEIQENRSLQSRFNEKNQVVVRLQSNLDAKNRENKNLQSSLDECRNEGRDDNSLRVDFFHSSMSCGAQNYLINLDKTSINTYKFNCYINEIDRLNLMRSRTQYIRERMASRYGGNWFCFIIFNSRSMESQWSMNGYKKEYNYFKIGNYEYYVIES